MTGGGAFNGFDAFSPDPACSKQDDFGGDWADNWKTLEPIQAEQDVQHVDLPEKLRQLIKFCWKSATPMKSERGHLGRVQIGGGQRAVQHDARLNAVQGSFMPNSYAARTAPYVKQVQPLSPGKVTITSDVNRHLQGVPTDWKTHDQLTRVSAYTLRGDTRDPETVKGHRGFQPPITRTDKYYVDTVIYPEFNGYMQRRFGTEVSKDDFDRALVYTCCEDERRLLNNFFVWRGLVEREAYHAGRMLASETLKGYISTTRSVKVAKSFAKKNGWVYVLLVKGGFVIPDKGSHYWTEEFGEQEIAFPGAVPWEGVFGFRHLEQNSSKFTGPVYLRKGFKFRNPKAFTQVFELLSGKKQHSKK
jgi:hypothetical protein